MRIMRTLVIARWLVIIALCVAASYMVLARGNAPISDAPGRDAGSRPAVVRFDPRNATYVIQGRSVTLADGYASSEAAPGSASRYITRYFGNDATGDLDGDGVADQAFFLTEETGGSGVFFYAVAVLTRPDGHVVTNAFFVGDRIAPQNMLIRERELHVNYAVRRQGEPMSAAPSEGAVLLLKVTPEGVLEGLMR